MCPARGRMFCESAVGYVRIAVKFSFSTRGVSYLGDVVAGGRSFLMACLWVAIVAGPRIREVSRL